MQQITTSWLAFLALGAGVILLALAPGIGIPVAAAPVGLGLFEFGWGAAVLYSNRLVLPRTMCAVALVAPVGWTVILLVALVNGGQGLESSLGFYPMAVVTVFNLILVAAVARQFRRSDVAEGRVRTVRNAAPLLYLTALMVGGIAVSVVTTPALAATQAGIVNVHSNHGEHNAPEHDAPQPNAPELNAPELNIPEHAGH